MQVSSAITWYRALFNFELVKELPRPLRASVSRTLTLCLQEAFLGEGDRISGERAAPIIADPTLS